MDAASFEVECLRKQINIAHSKIQELETELTKTKNTNFILGERIKTFETTNTREVYERYFPRNTDPVHSKARSDQDISTHNYHTPLHSHCCYPPPPCRTSCCHPRGEDTGIGDIVRELSSKVTSLSSYIANLKSEITESIMIKLTQQVNAPTENPLEPPPPEALLDPHQPEHSPCNVSNTSNMSETNTIDDNVPAFSPQNSLNCLATTTQLQQLRHIQQSS